jgi:hypothetical protein
MDLMAKQMQRSIEGIVQQPGLGKFAQYADVQELLEARIARAAVLKRDREVARETLEPT